MKWCPASRVSVVYRCLSGSKQGLYGLNVARLAELEDQRVVVGRANGGNAVFPSHRGLADGRPKAVRHAATNEPGRRMHPADGYHLGAGIGVISSAFPSLQDLTSSRNGAKDGLL
jgi:hypothetical protein